MRHILHRYELTDDSRRTWWSFWLAITSFAQNDQEVAERLANHHHSTIEKWVDCLERGQLAGDFRLDLEPHGAAASLSTYAHGLAVHQLIDPSGSAWAVAELTRTVEALRVNPDGDGGPLWPRSAETTTRSGA